jgi:glycosyltransferase involved in cell wall biosynthesis
MTVHVAINASLDPRAAGGVQTNFVSLARSLKARSGELRATLICPPAIEIPLRDEVSPQFDVHTWGHTFPWYRKTAEEEARAAASYSKQLAKEEQERERLRIDRDATLRKLKAEVLHFPHQVVYDSELPTIYEPWDLQHMVLPDLFTSGERDWRTALYGRACNRAKLVVTATQATKRDVVSLLGIDAGKVLVIPRDSRELTPHANDAARLASLKELNVAAPYLFYPAMSFPHKNHIRLLEALAILRDRHGLVIPLVCSGRKHAPFWPTVEAVLTKYKLQQQAQFVGAVTDEQLAALFASATALAFPSRFEGLGLPLLEAMQFGVPIAASNTSCIPEVVGDAALLFDQEDPEAIAAVIQRLWNDEALRRDLSAKALVQRRANTWDDAAQTFIAAYRYCAGYDLSAADRSRIDRGLAAW